MAEPFHVTDRAPHPTVGRDSSSQGQGLELLRRTKARPCPAQAPKVGLGSKLDSWLADKGSPGDCWPSLELAASNVHDRTEETAVGQGFQPSLTGPTAQPSHCSQLERGLNLPELPLLREKADTHIFM